MRRIILNITTDSNGDGETIGESVVGMLYAIQPIPGTLDAGGTVTFTSNPENPIDLLSQTGITSAVIYPRTGESSNEDGAGLDTSTMPVVAGNIKIVVSGGGDTASGSFILFVLDNPLKNLTAQFVTNNIGGEIFVITKTFNDAEIKHFPSLALDLVPRPGEGKYNAFIQATVTPDIVADGEYGNITDGAYMTIGYEDDVEIASLILDDSGNSANGLTSLLVTSAGTPGGNTNCLIPNERFISGWGLVSQYSIGRIVDREDKALQVIVSGNTGDFDGGDPDNTLTVTVVYAVVDL